MTSPLSSQRADVGVYTITSFRDLSVSLSVRYATFLTRSLCPKAGSVLEELITVTVLELLFIRAHVILCALALLRVRVLLLLNNYIMQNQSGYSLLAIDFSQILAKIVQLLGCPWCIRFDWYYERDLFLCMTCISLTLDIHIRSVGVINITLLYYTVLIR